MGDVKSAVGPELIGMKVSVRLVVPADPPAPLVVDMVRLVCTAVDDQVRFFDVGLPLTVPDVYVQPVGAVSVPKVLDTIPDWASVPVLVMLTVLLVADGRK